MFLNSSTKFQIFKLIFAFKFNWFKSQAGPFNHDCFSFYYPDTFYSAQRASALRALHFCSGDGGVGSL